MNWSGCLPGQAAFGHPLWGHMFCTCSRSASFNSNFVVLTWRLAAAFARELIGERLLFSIWCRSPLPGEAFFCISAYQLLLWCDMDWHWARLVLRWVRLCWFGSQSFLLDLLIALGQVVLKSPFCNWTKWSPRFPQERVGSSSVWIFWTPVAGFMLLKCWLEQAVMQQG